MLHNDMESGSIKQEKNIAEQEGKVAKPEENIAKSEGKAVHSEENIAKSEGHSEESIAKSEGKAVDSEENMAQSEGKVVKLEEKAADRKEIDIDREKLITPQEVIYPKHASKGHNDYCITYSVKTVDMGFCQLQNKRVRQEDYLAGAVEEVSKFYKLSPENQETVLKMAFNKIQMKYGQAKDQGSTCCSATAWLDDKDMINVVTAGLGDSWAVLLILDEKNTFVVVEQLNHLHKPDDKEEMSRIIQEGGHVKNGRLNGELAMSRALGDMQYEGQGISHIPDIDFFGYKLNKGHKAILIVASDGLDTILDNIDFFVEKCFEEKITTPASIANFLAINAQGGDNASCAVAFVGKIPVSLLVCDGHSGQEVAWNAAENFYSILNSYVNNIIKSMAMIAAEKALKPARAKRGGLFAAKPKPSAEEEENSSMCCCGWFK
jgi:serine/threonine protein phosphatase PrpC